MRIKTTKSIPVFCFGLLLLLFLASGLLGAPVNVSRSSNWPSTSPRIAVDSAGNLHVVWAEYYTSTTGDAFYAKFDNSTKQWGPPVNLTSSAQVHSNENRAVGIDVDASNNIYVSIVEANTVKLRIYSGGVWNPPITLATSNGKCDTPRVAVDASANIWVCWWDTSVYTVYSRARIGGTWEAVKGLSKSQSKLPDIAVGPNGVYCVWTTRNSSGVYQINYVQRGKSFDALWSSPQLVYPGTYKQQVPAVEIDDSDIPHIVWTPVNSSGNRTVVYSYRTGTGFSTPLPVSSTKLLHYPALTERGGNLYVSWQVGGYGNGTSISFNNRRGGVWTGEAAISDSDGSTYCDVGVNVSQTQAFFVWDASGEIWCESVSYAPKYDLLGTWDGEGVFYRNSDTGVWFNLGTPADFIAGGDLDGDSLDDLIGVWAAQDGVFTRTSAAGDWAKLGSAAIHVSSGDMNGDGRDDLLGSWEGQGVYYRDSAQGAWVKMATPADLVTAGDLDGDQIDDLIGVWPAQGGVWGKSSKYGTWYRIASTARDIACGDMNGDGKLDLLGTWDGQGVFYGDNATQTWVKMADSADQVAAGDLDGDGTDDLIALITSQDGIWVKYSKTGAWAKLAPPARDIAAGLMSGGAWGTSGMLNGLFALSTPVGGLAEGPGHLSEFSDLSVNGPGGWRFSYQEEKNPNPEPAEPMMIKMTPGPGDPGFRWAEEPNLSPQETSFQIPDSAAGRAREDQRI
jgi:hypothetical protein